MKIDDGVRNYSKGRNFKKQKRVSSQVFLSLLAPGLNKGRTLPKVTIKVVDKPYPLSSTNIYYVIHFIWYCVYMKIVGGMNGGALYYYYCYWFGRLDLTYVHSVNIAKYTSNFEYTSIFLRFRFHLYSVSYTADCLQCLLKLGFV